MSNNALTNTNSGTQGLVVGDDAETRDLSGAEKAAVILLALVPDYGTPIF